MPYYKDNKYFIQLNSLNGSQFDSTYGVSTPAPKAGIYRCTLCGHEIAIAQDHMLPPDGNQHHPAHQHTSLVNLFSPYGWQLVAQARHVHDKP